MAKKDTDRIVKLIAFPKDMVERVKDLSKEQQRSFTAQITFIIQTFLEKEDEIAAKKAKRSG